MILKEVVAEDLRPLRKGGITFYPAASLPRIFEWAEEQSRTLEWVEGVFYRPDTQEGELSGGYIAIRRKQDHASFKSTCLDLISEFEAEAASKAMGAYFEIGISH